MVIGASSDIGYAACQILAERGYDLLLTGRKKSSIHYAGPAARFKLAMDLRRKDDINRLREVVKKSERYVDLLLNLAGVWHEGQKACYVSARLEQVEDAGIENALAVVGGSILAVKRLLPFMHRDSSIINTSCSFEEAEGARWVPYYSACKAMEAFTTSLATELKENPYNIRTNCIAPSWVNTEPVRGWFFKQPEEMMLSPEEVAYAIADLAESRSTHSTTMVSGQIIHLKKK